MASPPVNLNNPDGRSEVSSRMDSSAATTSPQSQRESKSKKKWVEPITALVMALATVGTAWCSFESAAWTRRSNRLMNEFNSLERKAGLLNVQGMQVATIHTAMFMQLLAAKQAGNETLAKTYVERFPPDLRKAYDAWLQCFQICQHIGLKTALIGEWRAGFGQAAFDAAVVVLQKKPLQQVRCASRNRPGAGCRDPQGSDPRAPPLGRCPALRAVSASRRSAQGCCGRRAAQPVPGTAKTH